MKRTIIQFAVTLFLLSYSIYAQTYKMEYSTYIGGSSWDYGHAITVDDQGCAYVAGQANSSNYPTTVGAFAKTKNGSSDILVTKLNKEGSALVYSTYIGGSLFDDTRKVFVDKSGSVYLTGTTQSTNFPTTSSSLQGNSKGYFLKLDSLGSKIAYSSKWNGGDKILVDSKGYVIIMGSTDSTKFPTTLNAYSRTLSGGSDLFVAKIDISNNQIIFSTLIGGGGNEWAPSMILDSQDNIIIAGQTTSQNFPIKGNTFANYAAGKSNVFVTKLKSDGTQLLFSAIVGGTDNDSPRDITVDLSDNVYVTGVTQSSDFPMSSAAFSKTYKGLQDAFLFKLKSDGSQLIYSSYIGGTDKDGGRGVVVDKYGKAYITGCTRSTNFPVSTNAFDKTYNGGGSDQWAWGDPFLLVMNTDGTQAEYSTYLGGSNDEEAYGIAIDKLGDIYLCGVTTSSNFPTTQGAYDRTLSGGCNIYVTKFIKTDSANEMGYLKDDRDGKSYKTVKIGNQWWMAENFNYYTSTGSKCYDNDSVKYAQSYGRLYNWNTANSISPEGWRLPTHDDWKELFVELGMSPDEFQLEPPQKWWFGTNEGDKLKEKGTEHWSAPNAFATNESGFSALPGGHYSLNQFWAMTTSAHFWSGQRSSNSVWYISLGADSSKVHIGDAQNNNSYRSVRYIKNTTTDIENHEESNNYLPENFQLLQNYPNPFNPTTKIRFSLAKNSFTKLEVFNLLGQKVDGLINQELNAGTHEVEFNASNLTAGTYFYRIQAGEYSSVKKLVLVK